VELGCERDEGRSEEDGRLSLRIMACCGFSIRLRGLVVGGGNEASMLAC
jgi:hypothetical protein